jgi:hypothetical protein
MTSFAQHSIGRGIRTSTIEVHVAPIANYCTSCTRLALPSAGTYTIWPLRDPATAVVLGTTVAALALVDAVVARAEHILALHAPRQVHVAEVHITLLACAQRGPPLHTHRIRANTLHVSHRETVGVHYPPCNRDATVHTQPDTFHAHVFTKVLPAEETVAFATHAAMVLAEHRGHTVFVMTHTERGRMARGHLALLALLRVAQIDHGALHYTYASPHARHVNPGEA